MCVLCAEDRVESWINEVTDNRREWGEKHGESEKRLRLSLYKKKKKNIFHKNDVNNQHLQEGACVLQIGAFLVQNREVREDLLLQSLF